MYLDAIKTGGNGVACRLAVVVDDARQLFQTQGARHGGVFKRRNAVANQHGLGFGADRRGCDGSLSTGLQVDM